MNPPTARSPFFAGVWAGLLPLLVWALHFAFCYTATAAGCVALLRHEAAFTAEGLSALLGGATALAAVAECLLLLHACRGVRRAPRDLLPAVRLAGALIALVGILWAGLPVALLPPCGP